MPIASKIKFIDIIGIARTPGWSGLTNSGSDIGPWRGLDALVRSAGKIAGMMLRSTTETVGRNIAQARILDLSIGDLMLLGASFVFFGVLSLVSFGVSLDESFEFDLFLPKFSFLF